MQFITVFHTYIAAAMIAISKTTPSITTVVMTELRVPSTASGVGDIARVLADILVTVRPALILKDLALHVTPATVW